MPALSCPRCCKRVQPEVGQIGGLRMTVNRKDSAFFVQFVEHWLLPPPVEHIFERTRPGPAQRLDIG